MDNYENNSNNINVDIGTENIESASSDEQATKPIITDEFMEEKEKIEALTDNEVEKEFKAKPGSEPVVMPGIKAAFCIMLVAVLFVSAYFLFFNRNVKGVWTTDQNDVHTVLNFKENGVVEMTIGTITIKGDYKILDDADSDNDEQASNSNDHRINISIVYSTTSFMYGDFTYDITGNFFTGRTLKLTDDSNNSMTLESGKKETILKPDADRKYTKKLIGVWENENMTYTFTEDGFMYLDLNYISFECSYSDNGEKIVAQYYTPEETSVNIDFAFQGDDTVVIDGLVFTRKKGA